MSARAQVRGGRTAAPAPAAAVLARPTWRGGSARRAGTAAGPADRGVAVRAKLVVGGTDDRAEREADRLADLTLDPSVPAPLARDIAASRDEAGGQTLRRQARTQDQEEEEEDEAVRRKSAGSGGGVIMPAVEVAIGGGGGQPLPEGVRTLFEGRFGHDFSRVRVHADARAATAARDLRAQAFTHGQDVYFGAGYYRPQERTGRWLLAHELTHTLQNRPGVIARRSLDAEPGGEPGALAPPGAAEADAVIQALEADPEDRSGLARARLQRMDLATRRRVLAEARYRLGPEQRGAWAAALAEPGVEGEAAGAPADAGGARPPAVGEAAERRTEARPPTDRERRRERLRAGLAPAPGIADGLARPVRGAAAAPPTAAPPTPSRGEERADRTRGRVEQAAGRLGEGLATQVAEVSEVAQEPRWESRE